MARCFLCDPSTDYPDTEIAEHLMREHDLDMAQLAAKWPDGEWVVHDRTLEPADFKAQEGNDG